MLYALLISAVYELIHYGVAAFANGKAQVVYTIAMLLDKFVVGVWIVIHHLMQLDDEALWRHDGGQFQSVFVVFAIVHQVGVGGIYGLVYSYLGYGYVQ